MVRGLGDRVQDNSTAKRRTSQARRGEITAAALDCLIQHGYAGLTARRVAGRAGISLGHLTYHFANMEEVMVETYRLVAQRLQQTAKMEAVTGLSPTERLALFLQSVYAPETLTPENIRLRIDLWSAAQEIPAVAEIERALFTARQAEIEKYLTAIADPYKVGRIPQVLAFVTATMDGLWLDYMRHGDIEATDAAIDACALFAKMRLGGS